MEPNIITLILHHRGSFVREKGELNYVGGEFCVWEGLDVDTVNLFTVEKLCKEHYYRRFEKIFWPKPGRDLDLGLRELVKDAHVVEMCNAGRENNGEVEIYFLHPVDLPFIIVDENSESGQQKPKPTDVTDHTAMASPESGVSPPMPQPMPSCEMPHKAAPMESPLPTPIVSPIPTLVPSLVPPPVPTLVPSPVPSHESCYSDDYESAEDSEWLQESLLERLKRIPLKMLAYERPYYLRDGSRRNHTLLPNAREASLTAKASASSVDEAVIFLDATATMSPSEFLPTTPTALVKVSSSLSLREKIHKLGPQMSSVIPMDSFILLLLDLPSYMLHNPDDATITSHPNAHCSSSNLFIVLHLPHPTPSLFLTSIALGRVSDHHENQRDHRRAPTGSIERPLSVIQEQQMMDV
ncbi:hypothetical protein SESBI_39295 [Sesbania bispinosa]|nr:hypothetical protein SESBI_39295 [Sesbania bispinosa]